jgi:hypothetical protein
MGPIESLDAAITHHVHAIHGAASSCPAGGAPEWDGLLRHYGLAPRDRHERSFIVTHMRLARGAVPAEVVHDRGGASNGLLDPIEGVSMAVCASLQAKQVSASPEEFTSLLAQHQMDRPKWERVAKGWLDRMTRDTTGVVATEYAKGFAGGGQYGAMGAAAMDNVSQGQTGREGPQMAAGAPAAVSERAEPRITTPWARGLLRCPSAGGTSSTRGGG